MQCAFAQSSRALHEAHSNHPRPSLYLDAILCRPRAPAPAASATAAHRDQMLPLAIHADFELVGFARAPRGFHFDVVLAIQWKVAVDRHATPRSEGQIFHAGILRLLEWQ